MDSPFSPLHSVLPTVLLSPPLVPACPLSSATLSFDASLAAQLDLDVSAVCHLVGWFVGPL